MLAAAPLHEMAETLYVLAGPNAGEAARYFGRLSYEVGDIGSAILWTNVARVADRWLKEESESAML